jgi:hypothetical protein
MGQSQTQPDDEQMRDAACTAAPVPDPEPSKGLARPLRARWKHGLYSAEALAEQERVRELLAQSRELLKQMQAD